MRETLIAECIAIDLNILLINIEIQVNKYDKAFIRAFVYKKALG